MRKTSAIWAVLLHLEKPLQFPYHSSAFPFANRGKKNLQKLLHFSHVTLFFFLVPLIGVGMNPYLILL